jgi:hypothetical protein
MNVYFCTSFSGHWPVGTAAVVIAPSDTMAADLLNEELLKKYLKADVRPQDMQKIDHEVSAAYVLCDGNY